MSDQLRYLPWKPGKATLAAASDLITRSATHGLEDASLLDATVLSVRKVDPECAKQALGIECGEVLRIESEIWTATVGDGGLVHSHAGLSQITVAHEHFFVIESELLDVSEIQNAFGDLVIGGDQDSTETVAIDDPRVPATVLEAFQSLLRAEFADGIREHFLVDEWDLDDVSPAIIGTIKGILEKKTP